MMGFLQGWVGGGAQEDDQCLHLPGQHHQGHLRQNHPHDFSHHFFCHQCYLHAFILGHQGFSLALGKSRILGLQKPCPLEISCYLGGCKTRSIQYSSYRQCRGCNKASGSSTKHYFPTDQIIFTVLINKQTKSSGSCNSDKEVWCRCCLRTDGRASSVNI